MKVTYSAPAKIILSGEHAVVYGKPALIASVDLRLTITVFRKMVIQRDATIKMMSDIVLRYLTKNDITHHKKPYGFTITSQIPAGANLGSSAALSVASTGAFLHFYTGRIFSKDIINKLAYEVEKYFHGNPSGADNSTSCFGGLIYYQKESEAVKNITPLHFSIPTAFSKNLFIIDGGKPIESTKEMVVGIVGNRYKEQPKKTQIIFNEIEKCTKRMVASLEQNKPQQFKRSIEENERCLESLGVVSEQTKIFLKQLRQFGVGKVTGAGGRKCGSGNILFFANDSAGLMKYLQRQNLVYIKFIKDDGGVLAI